MNLKSKVMWDNLGLFHQTRIWDFNGHMALSSSRKCPLKITKVRLWSPITIAFHYWWTVSHSHRCKNIVFLFLFMHLYSNFETWIKSMNDMQLLNGWECSQFDSTIKTVPNWYWGVRTSHNRTYNFRLVDLTIPNPRPILEWCVIKFGYKNKTIYMDL